MRRNMRRNRDGVWLAFAALVILGAFAFVVRRSNLNQQLLDAVQNRRAASVVQDLIRQGANPSATATSEYDSALFRAIDAGTPETVKVLLNAGASMQPVGGAKVTPMIAVASSNKFRGDQLTEADDRRLIQELQSKGESIEERDSLGFTPLMRAVWSGNTAATGAFLDLGADTHAVSNCGQTIMSWTGNNGAAKQAQLEKLLHEHDADARQRAATVRPVRQEFRHVG